MDLGTMENGRNSEDDDGGQDRESSGYLMGLNGGKGKQGKGQYNGYCQQNGQWGYTAKNGESMATVCYNGGQLGLMAKSCPEKRKRKAREGRQQGRQQGEEKRQDTERLGMESEM